MLIKASITYRRKVKEGIKKFKSPKAFIDCSQTIDDVYGNLGDYNQIKKRKVLIAFDDMVEDMEANRKSSLIVTELFLRGRRLNISLAFIKNLI